MVWNALMMMNQELYCEGGYSLTDKMVFLITGQALRTTKLGNYVLENKPCCCVCISIPNNFIFIPMSQVVSCGNNVLFL